jgi:predicted RNA binding protein YcfA (HicA-like mRNA interferase family)
MPPFGPIKRRDLIANLKTFGWTGPYPGGNHEYMVQGQRRLPIPNPHQGHIAISLLQQILRKAGTSRADWEAR